MTRDHQHNPLRRRWFQFGLRTMFVVVTAFAFWLAWELKFIRERQAFLARMKEQGSHQQFADDTLSSPTIPVWRRWLGDRAVEHPGYPIQEQQSPTWTEKQVDRHYEEVFRLFPESIEHVKSVRDAGE